MKVLVTGGSGFLGGHIVQECESRGDRVTIYDLHKPNYQTGAEYLHGDITKTIEDDLEMFDVIFHTAGELGSHTTFDRIRQTFDVNVGGMLSLMEAAKKGVRIINMGLIRDWLNPYMISKHTAASIGQMYATNYGIDFIDVRMTVVYGPRQGWSEEKIVPRFILSALNGEELPVFGDGTSVMNMMYVKDVANILCDIGFSDMLPTQMDMANPGGDISVNDFGEIIAKRCGGNLKKVPMRIGQPGQVGVAYDLDAIEKVIVPFSDRFRTLEEGLTDTIAWYRSLL